MLKILQITNNPKRKHKNKIVQYDKDASFKAGYDARSENKKLNKNPYSDKSLRKYWKKGWQTADKQFGFANRSINRLKKRIRKRKIIRVRKNPPRKYQTIITGLIRTRQKRFKTYYFTGRSFVHDKSEAKIYPGSLGKVEAKRILPMLPRQIESLSVERV